MSASPDSRQLEQLRFRFKRDHHHRGEPAPQATPERLGEYAARASITIDDLGAHSKRWCRRFRAGVEKVNP